MTNKPAVSVRDAEQFLTDHHEDSVDHVAPLEGGFWTAAFGYELCGRRLVFRVCDFASGFEADREAMVHTRPGLPIPAVLHLGLGLGHHVSISERHDGRFLELVAPDEASVVGSALVGLLEALRSVPDDDHDDPTHAWRTWLFDGLRDRPDRHTAGWRVKVAAIPSVDRTFRECERRITDFVEAAPARRDLVHSDLLHQNVLLNDTGEAVTAVFSWKCATRGDFLYDTAWCTFWGRYHDGIGAIDTWSLVTSSAPVGDLVDAAARHHAYELHIGASHLGWYATLGDDNNLHWTAEQLGELLERGPRSAPVT